MSREANLILCHRSTDALNARDWTALAEIMTPEAVAGFQASSFLAAFPDIHITADAEWVDGDYVIQRWTDRATHLGEFMGIPPTGRTIQFTGIGIDHIVNGKIVESWIESDTWTILQQLGAAITPPASS